MERTNPPPLFLRILISFSKKKKSFSTFWFFKCSIRATCCFVSSDVTGWEQNFFPAGIILIAMTNGLIKKENLLIHQQNSPISLLTIDETLLYTLYSLHYSCTIYNTCLCVINYATAKNRRGSRLFPPAPPWWRGINSSKVNHRPGFPSNRMN